MSPTPTRATDEQLLESAMLSITVALRNVKTLQGLAKHDENNLMEGPEFQFVAINLQNATQTLKTWAENYTPPSTWTPPPGDVA